ncbi:MULTISPECIES: PadR family transcriptional regulator [Paenibacillus]|uniref:PadR family transcriptional regulator n=1 Tax=Paenibacillus TaxID=44249 RepID=UPI00088F8918|nr:MULTISPECIES: PadR family transcriptional regulator [Paenibacillus]SDI07419.1 DNA-binding transcriptional regulator, PadR family [Paenibacillus naphthalenovorans]
MKKEWQQEERLFLFHGHEREAFGSGRRYFSRGGVKYALLELLQQENMHGYQMMKALEEQSGGTYKPSAGSIYPTLQMLRDQGFVEAYKVDGKKIFHITDEGRAYLQEEKDRPELSEAGEQGWEEREQSLPEEDNGHWEGVRRNRRLTPKGKELLHLLKAAERAALSDADKAVELRELLDNLRDSLRRIVADSGRNGGEGGRP